MFKSAALRRFGDLVEGLNRNATIEGNVITDRKSWL